LSRFQLKSVFHSRIFFGPFAGREDAQVVRKFHRQEILRPLIYTSGLPGRTPLLFSRGFLRADWLLGDLLTQGFGFSLLRQVFGSLHGVGIFIVAIFDFCHAQQPTTGGRASFLQQLLDLVDSLLPAHVLLDCQAFEGGDRGFRCALCLQVGLEDVDVVV
jgi:hypothetical protein